MRDTTGFVFDSATSDPITYTHNIGQIRLHNQLRAAQFLDKRTQLLDAGDLIDDAALDPYAFMRDSYLQKRASDVQDGLVPIDLLGGSYDDGGFEPADEDIDIPLEGDTSAATEVPAADYEPLADYVPAT